MKSILNFSDRRNIFGRIKTLDASKTPLWGQLTAPRMVAHLSDQMRITLGELQCKPILGPQRLPIIRQLILYVLPWPKGKIKGPPEAFLTAPTEWATALATLEDQVKRFADEEPGGASSDHPILGPMSRKAWGIFCHRHFDHHLRQFGV